MLLVRFFFGGEKEAEDEQIKIGPPDLFAWLHACMGINDINGHKSSGQSPTDSMNYYLTADWQLRTKCVYAKHDSLIIHFSSWQLLSVAKREGGGAEGMDRPGGNQEGAQKWSDSRPQKCELDARCPLIIRGHRASIAHAFGGGKS